MKKNQYIKFANKSLEFLNSKYSNNITFSISSLHAIKHHPEYLIKINKVSIFKLLKILVKNFLELLLIVVQIFKKKTQVKNEQIDVFLISHLTNSNQIKKKTDPYFGILENIFKKKNIKFKKILINHTKSKKFLQNKNKNFLFSKYLQANYELKIRKKKFFEFLKIFKIILNTKNKIMIKVLKRSLISLFENETTFALRLKYELEIFLDAFKPKVLITTFEGYGWERICFNVAKDKEYNTKCIGYQHTPLSHNNVSAYYRFKKNYNPDLIWCSDKNSYNLLKQKKINKVLYVGRFSDKKKNNSKPKKLNNYKNTTCLVVPEGLDGECLKLFQFSINCCEKYKSLKFIWRLHPIMKKKRILKMLNLKKNKLHQNITISKKKKLTDDLSKSNFVLYRGSSAVIEAVQKGLIPLYLNSDQHINIDPLKSVINRKNYVNTIEDFNLIIENFKKKKISTTKLSKDFKNFDNTNINKNLIISSLYN